MTDEEKAEARKANSSYFNPAQEKESQVQLSEEKVQPSKENVQSVGSETDLPKLHFIEPVSLEEFMTATPPEYVVDHLITKQSVNLFYAPAKTGKTYLALQLAEAIAFEEPFLGLETTCPGRILYLNFDMGSNGFNDRARQVLRGFRNKKHSEADLLQRMDILDRFKLKDQGSKVPDFFKAETDMGVRDLRYFIERRNIKLVIADTLARIKGNAKENDNDEIITLMGNIEKFFKDELDCVSILIDHAGKDGDLRGASAKKGQSDFVMKLQSTSSNNQLVLKTDGSRYDEPSEIDIFTHWEKDEEGNPLSYWTDLVEPGTDKSNVIKWLKDNGNCATTKSYIAEHATGNKQDNMKIINSLIASGKLEGIDLNKTHRGKPIIYYRLKERTL